MQTKLERQQVHLEKVKNEIKPAFVVKGKRKVNIAHMIHIFLLWNLQKYYSNTGSTAKQDFLFGNKQKNELIREVKACP